MSEEAYLVVREMGKETRHDLVGQVGYAMVPMLNAIRIWDEEHTYHVGAGELIMLKVPNAARQRPHGDR